MHSIGLLVDELEQILFTSEPMRTLLMETSKLGLADYYIGAGCVAQTVWNYQLGLDLSYGISDYDVVYYNSSDLSVEAELQVFEKLKDSIGEGKVSLDVRNQARVHLWYREYFGYNISPYSSVEDAIDTWPTTATSVGVRLENEELKVYAPFGLDDLFEMIVRANKAQITEEIYKEKICKWRTKWPSLTVIPW